MSILNFIRYRFFDLLEYVQHTKGKLENLFLLKYHDYTLISNNCWGGWVYRYYGSQYLSPTIGNFIMSEDYLRFIKNLKYYLNIDMVFISPNAAHDREWLVENVPKFGQYPIGRIDDVDVHFLHAHSKEQALSDWNRRKSRVNFSRVIIKFSTQNHWTLEQCEEFKEWDFPTENKLFFSTQRTIGTNYEKIFVRDKDESNTRDEGKYYTKYVNMTQIINNSVNSLAFFNKD